MNQAVRQQFSGNFSGPMRQALLSRGWTPPTRDQLEQAQTELGNPMGGAQILQQHTDQQVASGLAHMTPGPALPNMANPYGGYGTALPAQFSFDQPLQPMNPVISTAGDGRNENGQMYQQLALSVDPAVPYELQNLQLAGPAPGSNAYRVNTIPLEQYLRTTFIEGKVLQRIAPMLVFLDLATRFTTDSIDIVWFRHNFSPDTEPGLRSPSPMGEDARFPRVTVGDPVKKMGSTGMWGLAIEFTRRALRHTNSAVDDIQRKIDWAAWKLAQKINTVYGRVLTGNFSTTQTGDDAVLTEQADLPWDDDLANPEKDIRDLALKMKTENGHYFRPTDFMITPEQYRDLLDFYTSIDRTLVQLNPLTGERVAMVDNIRIIEAPPASGIPDGFGIMLARNTGAQFGQPLTVWDAVDPEFTRSGILHTDRFRDPETKKLTVLMWKEFFVANRNPKAVGLMHTM